MFIDLSGSMAGYVAPPRPPPGGRGQEPAEPRLFRDVVLSLPQLTAHVAERMQVYGFGRTIRPLSQAEVQRGFDPRFYSEPESRIQDVLARMDALPAEEVSILVTDLFLTGEEVFGGGAAIRAPLARILASGRTIGLVGMRSGFAGTVYDIPGARSYAGAAERPFYLIACGPGPVVARLLRRLDAELIAPLPPPRDGSPRAHSVLFSHDPIRGGPAALNFKPGDGAEAVPSLAADLPPAASRVRFPGAAGTAAATLPLALLADGPALLPDQFRVSEQIWAERPGRDPRAGCAERWLRVQSLPQISRLVASASDGGPSLAVGGPVLARATPGVTFLLHARVDAVGLSDAPGRTAWVRGWNLEARDAEAFVAERPRTFKTLNLREVASMLEGLVRERVEPKPVGEALLAFQVPRGGSRG